ncbi:MAG TPA: DUF2341 domain-containing protein, partial [Acidimicrobiales bacterium]|nr:DUF2341 domain-containing protein [Acidimicrobiales bacterium]
MRPIARTVRPLGLALGLSSLAIAASADSYVVTTIPVSGGSNPGGVGANPVTNKVYVAVSGAPEVSVIDGSTNSIVTNIPLGGHFSLWGVAVNSVTNKIYVAHYANATGNQVHVIDGATDTAGVTIPVGTGPRWIGLNPAANRIYVGNAASNSITVIGGATDTPIGTVAVGGSPAGIGVHTGTNRVYVAIKGANRVESWDASFVGPPTLIPGMNDPNDVVVDSLANRAYVTNGGTNTVSVIDTTTDTVVGAFLVGGGPEGMALNPARTRLYVRDNSSNATILSSQSGVTDQTLGVGLGNSDAEYNAANGLVYVSNFSSGSVTVIADTGELCSDLPGSWWNSSWRRRRQIFINNGAIAGTHSNFPLLVTLDPSRIDYASTLAGGADLRFVADDDLTPLDYEIERWTPGGTSYVWVRIPVIPGISVKPFYMYYNNPAAPAAPNAPGVWGPSGHNLVQHLEETAGPHLDSATADGASNDSSAEVVTLKGNPGGLIDGADLFDDLTQDHVYVPDDPVLNVGAGESFTVEAWIRTSTTGQFQHIVSKEDDVTVNGFDLMIWSDDQARFSVFGDGFTATAQATVVTDGNWHYVVGRWDRATREAALFVDGVPQNWVTENNLALTSFSHARPLTIGEEGDSTPGFWFDGWIDEVRFSKQSRPNDWIRAQHLSMTNNYFWLGPEKGQCNLRSIGTRGHYGTAEAIGAGTFVSATQGSQTVTGTGGTQWAANNRGRGDVIVIDGVAYVVRGVNSNSQLRLTTPYAGPTGGGKSYSIRRQFTTLAAWEDCVDGLGNGGSCPFAFLTPASSSLVADHRGEVGIAFNDSAVPSNPDFTIGVTIDGSTTDAAHSIKLTADRPNRHYGLAGSGVLLDNTGNPNSAIRVFDDYVTVEWMEIQGGGATPWGIEVDNISPGTGTTGASRLLLRNNLIHVSGHAITLNDPDVVTDVYNNFIYDGAVGGTGIRVGPAALETWSQVRVLSNTIYNYGGSAFDSSVGAGGRPDRISLINNLAADPGGGAQQPSFVAASFAINPTSRNNLSTDARAGVGFASPGGGGIINKGISDNAVCSDVDGCVFFVSCPAAAGSDCAGGAGATNLHLRTGAPNHAVNTGASLGSVFTGDIDDGVRAAPWDVGADEFGTTEVELESFGASPGDRQVMVEWRTASELSNLGFHLYRALGENGPWTRLTTSLIPGLGSSAVGQAYSYRDSGLTNGTRY